MSKEDFKNDLEQNEEILKLIKDTTFTQNLYAALCNIVWMKEKDKHNTCSFSWKEAGQIVASIRNKVLGTNDDYIKWWCSGSRHPCSNACKLVAEGTVTDKIEELFTNMNWTVYKQI